MTDTIGWNRIDLDNDPCDEWHDFGLWFGLYVERLIPNVMNGVLMERPIMPGKSFASGGPINMHSRASFIMGNAGPEAILPRCQCGGACARCAGKCKCLTCCHKGTQ